MKVLLMLVVFAMSLSSQLQGKEISSIITGTPVIDGKLNDKVWKKNTFYSGFTLINKAKEAYPKSEFSMAQDDKNLYLAIRCFDADMKNIRADKLELEFNWKNDLVEFFVDADNSGDHYIHFAVNASNDRFQQRAMDFGTNHYTDFTLEWTSAVYLGKNSWTIEIKIPYKELLVLNKKSWKINICRSFRKNKTILDRHSTWGRNLTPTHRSRFHDLKLFQTVNGFKIPYYNQEELAIIKEKRARYKFDYKPSKEKIALLKIRDQMFVGNNIVVPNPLVCLANKEQLIGTNTVFYFDLPKGIELLGAGRKDSPKKNIGGGPAVYKWKFVKQVKHDGIKYRRYEVKTIKMHREATTTVGPLYFKSSLKDNTSSKMYYFSQNDNYKQKIEQIEMITKTFPEVDVPNSLVSSMAWMHAKYSMGWPGFAQNYKKLGFNATPIHTSFDGRVFDHKILADFAKKCKKAGLKIIYSGSALGAERLSSIVIDGKPLKRLDHCPSSPSPGKRMKEFIDFAKLIKADYYSLDIESYHGGAVKARKKQCKRCNDFFKTKKISIEEALENRGVKLVSEFKKALKELDTTKMGLYHTEPGEFTYQEMFKFDKLSNVGVSFVHPVRYSSNNAKAFCMKMRKLRSIAKSKDSIIPWMTTGYLVGKDESIEYPTEWVYDYVLEAYGSGCKGIYWFGFAKTEGSDLFYAAKAMQSIAPIANILSKVNQTYKLKTNTTVNASALRYKNNWIVLTSDYSRKKFSGKLEIALPETAKGKVTNPATGKIVGTVKGKVLTINNWQPTSKGASTTLYLIK